MNKHRNRRKRMMGGIILGVVALLVVAGVLFVNQPKFGKLPEGKRLERIRQSPHYRDGQFHNLHPTVMMTARKGRMGAMLDFLFKKAEGVRPAQPMPAVKTDLKSLRRDENLLVWFGHSSYLIQVDGKRLLVDPVFCEAAPLSFLNKPFEGTDIYKPADVPDVDYLIITHDHWDHLDYATVTQLKNRVGKVVCPLGVGAHLEYWGFTSDRLVELDWYEEAPLDDAFRIHCLPARHFSGRFLKSNQSLWASFLLQSPSHKIFMGGDSGYDTHFAEIGKRFPGIDLAILENGQYSENWRNIHTMPAYLGKVAKDLAAKRYLTVHHSKFALSTHPWDEPLRNAQRLREQDSLEVWMPQIGEVVLIDN